MTVSRALGLAVRRFADQQSDRLAELPQIGGTFLTITSTTGGTWLSWRGATIQATRVLPHYTPGVGDRVLVLQIDDQIIVVG